MVGKVLVDADRRGEASDTVDGRLAELEGDHAERFKEDPLAFLVEDIERHGRFPRARDAGEDDQFFFRQAEGDVLEVVETGVANGELSWHLDSN